MIKSILVVSSFLLTHVVGFLVVPVPTSLTVVGPQRQQQQKRQQPVHRPSPLFMGRAAAVRAATKAKTDGRKAKINALYGKKIIMAVKQGGSPDPEANRQLRDVIKQAKANSVPIDVSTHTLCLLCFRLLCKTCWLESEQWEITF